MTTYRMTTAQAIVKFLDQQYVSFDGQEVKFVEGIFTIFGHGIAVGLAEALEQNNHNLRVYQGRNEQGMAHAAIAYAKQNNRTKIIACSSSVGPGAANMLTAAATATVNRIPLLLFPADTYSTRQPDPVLQQLELPSDLSISTNDAFKPLCKFWDKIYRPEQLMSSLINAMRVLTDPVDTGAVCISLPQDTEGEAFDFPDYFFDKRVHRIKRTAPSLEELFDAFQVIQKSKKPLIIVGGGVKYSEARVELEAFCNKYKIPFAETQSGKSALRSSHEYCLGGIGTTGTMCANKIAKEADCIIAIGTRLSDFTTASKSLFQNDEHRFVAININRYDAYKMDAVQVVADAKLTIDSLDEQLSKINYISNYGDQIQVVKKEWDMEVDVLRNYVYDENFEVMIKDRDPRSVEEYHQLHHSYLTQTGAILAIRKEIEKDAILITAGGSLPSCLQRLWTTDEPNSYHAEYGYSCMGYECSAVLGVKLAKPNQSVYTLVGDGSFQMMHSELATVMQEKLKVNILVFDNCGFGSINNLEMGHGISSMATEFRYRDDEGKLLGNFIPVDYAKFGEAYGYKTYTVTTMGELQKALIDAKTTTLPVLMDIKVLPKTMTHGYDAWWNVGLAQVSPNPKVVQKWNEDILVWRNKARKY